MHNENDEILTFAEDPIEQPQTYTAQPWKVLVVDDDEEVHQITKLVLRDFQLDSRKITLLSAYSAAEAKGIMKEHGDIAVLLLDVVMETDDAGLMLVRWIREELKNSLVRIILRTGQPGAAPEKRVIAEYEINDYKSKTEITDIKLYTAITVALRGYRDLKTIRRSKEGFEKIVQASGEIFLKRSFANFYSGVLIQLTSLLRLDEDSLYLRAEGLALRNNLGEYRVLAGTGSYAQSEGTRLDDIQDQSIVSSVYKAIQQRNSFFEGDTYVGFFEAEVGVESIVVLRTDHAISEVDRELISVFSTNVAAAFTNMYLNQQMETSQQEIIFTLGEVVESRSRETGNHVRRVGEMTALLAEKMGLEPAEVELLKLAAPMHDIGKIGIDDRILNKPGRLEPQELVEMRKHCQIGFDILSTGKRGVLQLAAEIALSHHEQWDGNGYPGGLKGQAIPLSGRMVAVIDVFDALVHDRVYKPAWKSEEAFEYISRHAGTQFDPAIVVAFLDNRESVTGILNAYTETKSR